MGIKITEWQLKMRDNGIERRLAGLDAASKKVGNNFNSINSKLGGVSSGLSGITSQIPGLGSIGGAIASPIGIAAAGVVAVGAGLAKATSMAMDFEQGMAKINATAQLNKTQLNQLRDELIELGKNSTADIERIPDAYEKIISQTGDVGLSMDILKRSLKGAQAGFTDIDVVSGALAQTLSIVGKENTNAQEVLDTLFAAKRVGAGEFQDFANYMPGLIAAGRNLGIEFKQTAGLFAFMTGKGQDAAKSAMLIENAFSALQKSDIQKGLAGAGVNVFDKDGSIRDLGAIFGDLNKKLSGMTDKAKSNFLESIGLRDVQARNAFSILTGDVNQLNKSLDATKNAVGETDAAIANTSNTMTTWAELSNKFKGTMIEIGNAILPYVGKFISWISEGISKVVNKVKDWYNNSELLQDIVYGIGKWIEFSWFLLQKIGQLIKWIWDNSVAPFFEKIEKAYRMIKLLFKGGTEKEQLHASADMIETMFGKGALGMDKIKAATAPQEKVDSANQSVLDKALDGSGNKASLLTGDTAGSSSNDLKSGINSVSGGGKSVKNINVQIGKLVEELSIHTTNLKESPTEIKRMMEELLLRVINGSELTVASE